GSLIRNLRRGRFPDANAQSSRRPRTDASRSPTVAGTSPLVAGARGRHAELAKLGRRSWRTRGVNGIALAAYAAVLDERATFLEQWDLRGARDRQHIVL